MDIEQLVTDTVNKIEPSLAKSIASHEGLDHPEIINGVKVLKARHKFLNTVVRQAIESAIDRANHEETSMRDYHDACMKELYRMLNIDGSNGEYRFKWVALEINNLLHRLKGLEK